MSGLIGCLERASIEFNGMSSNDAGKAIKACVFLNGKVADAEKEAQSKGKSNIQPGINQRKLVEEIQGDMGDEVNGQKEYDER